MSFFQKITKQTLYADKDTLWDFISSPRNLKEITPPYMGFDIITDTIPEKMYAGMIIGYKVSPLFGIKTPWLTEITHVQDGEYFVDEQRIGPYKIWHHQHRLIEEGDAVIMEDIVTYQPPFGFLGDIANALIIKNKLNEIFAYRHKVLEDRFGKK